MLAVGTNNGTIKIFSLKGYEQEILDAHNDEIRLMTFVPNKGKLVSIDSMNNLKLWNLTNIEQPEAECKVPEPIDCPVTCIHITPRVTSQEKNHNHVFLGMQNGNIYIFDLISGSFCSMKVLFQSVFTKLDEKRMLEGDRIRDIKCHWTKMHRLLIAYENTAVIVFSLNKNREIRKIDVNPKKDGDKKVRKGKALAVAWCGVECKEFIVGYAYRHIEVYSAESSN